MKEIEASLPPRAKEYRFAIFPVRPGTEHKATHRPLKTILWSDWKNEGLEDDGALASYLERILGPGRYLIEPRDAHGKRVEKLAAFTIATDEEEEADMYDYDDDEMDMMPARGGRRRNRRRRGYTEDLPYLPPDDDDDDPVESRANVADMLSEQARLQSREREQVTRSSNDMVNTMLLMNQQTQRREDERRAEERRREEALAEARREEARREDDRRRDEERRREEARREDLRREEERRAEERRREEDRANQRMQLMMGSFTAAIPLLQKMFEPKNNNNNTLLETIIAKTMEPREDATHALLLKHVLDKSQGDQSINQVIQGMANVSKATVDMLQQQFSSMQGVTSEMYQSAMKRALDVAMKNPHATEEDRGVLGQILDIMGGAGELLGNLRGAQPQQMIPGMVPGQPMPGQPMPQQMMPGQVPGQMPVQQQQQQPAPGEQVETMEDIPTGIRAVGACLMAIQQGQYQDQAQYQNLLALMIREMPGEVRQAVATNDEATVMTQCGQAFAADPDLRAWITSPGVVHWLREFLGQLAPQIESMHQQISQAMATEEQQPPEQAAPPQDADGFIEKPTEAPPLSLADIAGDDEGDEPQGDEGEPSEDEGGEDEGDDPNDPV